MAVSLPFILLALNLVRLRAWFADAWMWIQPPHSPIKQLAWSGLGLSQLPLGAPILQVRTNEELKKMNMPLYSPDHVDEVEEFHPEGVKSLSATLRRKKRPAGDLENGTAKGIARS
jgi:hypothetical protein